MVLGGAASGKSAYAEGIARRSGRPLFYVATAEAGDEEMAARIARHRERRGQSWRLAEAGSDIGEALRQAREDEAVLLDGLGVWLAGVMGPDADLGAAEGALLAGLANCPGPVVVVSDEVGGGIVPANALARAFRDALGGINQRLAARAGLVALVVAGLPLALKGELP